MDEIRHVARLGIDGWLRVKLESGGEFSLPQYLKVKLLKTLEGRDYFEILEGPYQGEKGNVRRESSGKLHLVSGIKHLAAADVRFDRKKQQLWFGSKGPFSAFSGAFTFGSTKYTQISPGSYPLSIPDAPHAATRAGYYAYTDFHKTWFRIGLSTTDSRYLHVGEISEGCVTVRAFEFDEKKPAPGGFQDLKELAKTVPGALGLPYPEKNTPLASWDQLYEYLIIRRANSKSVGTLIVT